jgi:hypothetical protein
VGWLPLFTIKLRIEGSSGISRSVKVRFLLDLNE